MNDSRKHAKALSKLYRELKKKHPKATPPRFDRTTEALVYGIISEGVDSPKAKSIHKGIRAHFVDLNDLRVARQEEICEILGGNQADAAQTAKMLTDVLNAIFQKYDQLSLEELVELGKRQGRKELEAITPASRFAINYCVLTGLGGHAIPLTVKMIEYLKANGIVDPEASEDDIQGFIERQVSATNGYEFYSLLRRESESESSGGKTRKRTKNSGSSDSSKPKSTKKTKATKKTTSKTKRA
jgi:hypothetical protein